jgi:hypothetical protein
MNMLFRCASHLIAVSTLTLIVSTLASASNLDQAKSFKLAMGPMSASQKNQGPRTTENSTEVEIKPRHQHLKPHHHSKHGRMHHSG